MHTFRKTKKRPDSIRPSFRPMFALVSPNPYTRGMLASLAHGVLYLETDHIRHARIAKRSDEAPEVLINVEDGLMRMSLLS